MTGRTNYTGVGNSDAMQGPSQITDVYKHFDALIGQSFATPSDLPASGNWPGRTALVLTPKSEYQHDGTRWARTNGDRVTNGMTTTPPAGAAILHYYHRITDSTSGAGLVGHTFPVPFPNGVAHVFFTTISGSGSNPVVNGGSASRTGFTAIYSANPNTAVAFSYHAVGW